MRVNPNLVPDILSGISLSRQQIDTALLELSSGKRVNNPMDDPGAAAAMVQSGTLSGSLDRYTQNVNGLLSMMQTADSTLSATVTSVTQAITIGTQGASSTVTTDQRQALAQQVQEIFSSVLSNANATYNGVPLFGGTATDTAAYVADPTSPTGYQYKGNNGTNQAEIGVGYKLQTNLPGSQLFSNSASDVLGSLNALATALRSGTSTDISAATTQVQSALTYFNQQRMFYGNGMSTLNSQESFLSQETVNLKSQQTTLIGADPTEAATLLSQAQTAENAIMAAAAKVLPTTLMDYLK